MASDTDASGAAIFQFPADVFVSDSSLPGSQQTSPSLLLRQVRALLNAAEDVQIEEEVVQDLLDVIPEEWIQEFANGEESDTDANPVVDFDEVDVSPLFSKSEITDQTWTKQDIHHMLQYLKHHGMNPFIARYVIERRIPIQKLLRAFNMNLCAELFTRQPGTQLYYLRVGMTKEIRLRDKLPEYNTVEDVVELIRSSSRILILTGAGISVSCGIPDFRSRNGLYASLGEYDLDDPQQMFDLSYFKENPAVFYSFATKIYPSNFEPSPCHRFLKLVEDKGKLLRNYTQNIDTLETKAGVKRVLQCHGSFATASCLVCHQKVPGAAIEKDILAQRVALCDICNAPSSSNTKGQKKTKKRGKKGDSDDENDWGPLPTYPPGIMKPDITFFGEKLSDEFDHAFENDRDKVDLLLVIGTSLKVAPVAEMLYHLPHSIPQILINKTPVRHINPDVILLGNADDVVQHICNRLDWQLPSIGSYQPNLKRSNSELNGTSEPIRVGDSHVWLFEGAEGGRWLRDLQEELVGGNVLPTPPLSEPDRESKKPRVEN